MDSFFNYYLTNIKLLYTASQRKIESYGKRNQRILLQERSKHKIIEKETHLSSHNSKSVDYNKFKTYLVEKDKLNTLVIFCLICLTSISDAANVPGI